MDRGASSLPAMATAGASSVLPRPATVCANPRSDYSSKSCVRKQDVSTSAVAAAGEPQGRFNATSTLIYDLARCDVDNRQILEERRAARPQFCRPGTAPTARRPTSAASCAAAVSVTSGGALIPRLETSLLQAIDQREKLVVHLHVLLTQMPDRPTPLQAISR